MTITIRSRREGFWRCGIQHTVAAKDYPNDHFTPRDLKRLLDEEQLVITITQGEGEKEIFKPEDVADPRKMSLAELKKLAKEMDLPYAKTVKQAELAEAIMLEMGRCHQAEMDELDKLAGGNQGVADPAGETAPPADPFAQTGEPGAQTGEPGAQIKNTGDTAA